MKFSLLLICILVISNIQRSYGLECGDEQIDNCEVCATGEETGTCAKCGDHYFQFLYNYLCLPCDHMNYGDVGCEKNCKMDDDLGFICDENGCKDGFYSLDKISCESCNSYLSPNCGKCSYLPPPGKSSNEDDKRVFECQECINDQYKIFPDGKCYHCINNQTHCSVCHFTGNGYDTVCDECDFDYYVRNGNCVKCRHYPIYGGYCRECTDDQNDYDNIFCYCNETYIYNSTRTCAKCPEHCDYCAFDQNLKRPICKRCEDRYLLNSAKTCTYCGRGCGLCSFDSNEKPICSICFYEYELIDGKCFDCPNNCLECHLEDDEFICDKCLSSCVMNSEKKCFSCTSNCNKCEFDENDNLKCIECYSKTEDHIYYGLTSDSLCKICPEHCSKCEFDEDNNPKCMECYSIEKTFKYYGLNSASLCQQCPSYCTNCLWDKTKEDMICLDCLYGSLLKDGKCLRCPEGCYSCFWDETKGELGCYDCYQQYEIKDDKCLRCSAIPELGQGCESCSYDKTERKYKCHECVGRDYTNVTNSYECIYNLDPNNKQLYGCLLATYNYTSKNYECYNCKPEFIPILNDKNCRLPETAGLQSFCQMANNIGTEENPIYSCLSCKKMYKTTNVTDYRGAHDCYESEAVLILCEKATKDIQGNLQCIKCKGNFKLISYDTYNINICDSNCEYDGFKKNDWCYKCDDIYYGNPGCNKEKGCEYFSANDQFNCIECKVGYFKYTYGQCFKCIEGSAPCLECHMNESYNRFECDKCMDGYFVNDNKKCQVITCDEHPEVMSGCIICIDKIDEFKPQGKCQACKNGYIKDKDGTCTHCKAKKNGGPGCELCGYATDEDGNETNDIICKYCPGGFLTTDGKCYRCQDELENGCSNCTLEVNEFEKTEKLVCTNCYNDYIFSEHKHCIHFKSYTNKIPFCEYQRDILEKFIIEEVNTSSDSIIYNENSETDKYTNIKNNQKYEYKVNSVCRDCERGYVLKNNSCLPLGISNCSLLTFLEINAEKDYQQNGDYENYERYRKQFQICNEMCYGSKYVSLSYFYDTTQQVKVELGIKNDNPDENYYDDEDIDDKNNEEQSEEAKPIEIYETRTIRHQFYLDSFVFNWGEDEVGRRESIMSNNQIMNIMSKSYFCLDNLGMGGKFSPENLRKCRQANYIENNDTYECVSCVENYILDEDTKTCKQNIKVTMNLKPGFGNCDYVWNIGNISNPIYSCRRCHYSNDILVTSDTGAKFCTAKTGELAGCAEVYADTNYLNNVYNCTKCNIGYISYYNNFFEKITCQNIRQKPIKKREIDSTIFNPDEVEHVLAINGTCENSKLFTPDGKYCYACNNKTVGMVGCKGTCEFNLKKNISLKCQEGMCKTGFIEKTKGVCEPCETINEGCIECHYEDNYPDGYYGFKRKKKFSCDQCDNGYLRSEDGTCHHCSTLGFSNCKNCGVDEKHDNEIKCVECQPGYFVNDEGECIRCSENHIRGKENTCIKCDDIENGGIEGCESCQNVDNQPQCSICKPGFILLQNNYTCLRISSDVELEELPNCRMAFLNDQNHFECKKCNYYFILYEENNKRKCYNINFIDSLNPSLCDVFVNYGTDDKPKYSCSHCNGNQYIYNNDISLTRITYQINNTAICEYRKNYPSLENCTEATMIIKNDGSIKFNCSECIEDNKLYFHNDTDSYICKYKYFEKQCVVKYCKTCVPGNNYFCQVCLPADYEVSPLTGGCIKKMDKAPEVYFKDIFRLKSNQYKQIGARMMHGPFLSLRGLTNSQINTGHAFLVLLSFKLHYAENNRTRKLKENRSIKSYCQIEESLDETSEEPNVANFDCIGDLGEEEDLSEYELNKIEESKENDNGIFTPSNLNDLAENTDLTQLEQKEKTSFELENYLNLAMFLPKDINNLTSSDYHFDFTINGELNQDLNPESINVKIPLNQIQDTKVDCKFNIRENRNADLKCDLNLEQYKNNYNEFSLKVTEISDSSDTTIYLSRINEVKLIHVEEEEDKDNKLIIIITSVASAVVVVGAGVGFGIYLFRRNKLKLSQNNNNISDINKNNSKKIMSNNDGENGTKRVIKYNN